MSSSCDCAIIIVRKGNCKRKVVIEMDSTNTNVELIVQQGENVLSSMKNLKKIAKKKGKARFDLYEKFCANLHSFYIYTLMDPQIQDSEEVIAFQGLLDQFKEYFKEVSADFDSLVDIKNAEVAYEKAFPAYNAMVIGFGFPDREVNIKKF